MTSKSQADAVDTTIADIHKTRERLADEANGDIRAITAAARLRQEASGATTVSFAVPQPAQADVR